MNIRNMEIQPVINLAKPTEYIEEQYMPLIISDGHQKSLKSLVIEIQSKVNPDDHKLKRF
jgi:hypothetical protein